MKILTILTACFIVAANFINAQQTKYPCCNCIGDFCFNSKDILESKIVKKYGNGAIISRHEGSSIESRSHIYYDPFQKLWICFNASSHGHDGVYVIEKIFVSIVPFSKDTVLSKNRFSPFITKTKICIGFRESQVLELMGKPNRIDDAIARDTQDSRYRDEPGYGSIWGSKVLVYFPEGEDSLLMFCIHLENGIVGSFTLSCSE